MTVEAIRSAYEAFVVGDVDPLVAMAHPGLKWRARRPLPRFWRPPPS